MTARRGAVVGGVLAVLVGLPLLVRDAQPTAVAAYAYVAKPGDIILLPGGDTITIGGAPSASPSATPSAEPSPTPSPTPGSPSPTATSSAPTPTSSPSSTSSPSPSPSPTSTPTTTPPPTPPTEGFIGPEVAGLPTSGPAWQGVLSWAAKTPKVDLSDLNADGDVVTLAKALVYARTGDQARRNEVIAALTAVQASKVSRALELARGLGAYVLAADYIGYRDPAFVSWVGAQRTRPVKDGPANLIKCHEERPNNWGSHCGFSRMAADLYVGDSADLAKAAAVFAGWLGDRTKYAGFKYGDTSWQCDPAKPVGVNPPCTKSGHAIGGALPDDMRRGDSFTWPPVATGYPWEAMQGAVMQAEILRDNGYPDAWAWSDRALCRASDFLASIGWSATGDDTWTPFLLDARCGTSRAGSPPSNPGKNYGYTDWWAR